MLTDALRQITAYPELHRLQAGLKQALADLDGPMRVAIVGKLKAGKSTLMNAFLGEQKVPTGATEMTFNVNWFRYAETPEITVVFKNGQQTVCNFEELQDLTIRNSNKGDFIRNIKHINVGYPNELLRKFHLIDTPGLDSFYEVDAKNTLDFLGIGSDEIEKWTMSAAGDADAIVYLFSRTLSEYDLSVLRRFHGGVSQMNATNSIGVLTRVDDYFPQEQDAIGKARDIIDSTANEQAVLKKLFYTIKPICGILALGAQTMTREDFALLKRIAAFPAEILDRSVWRKGKEAFITRSFDTLPDFPVKEERARLAGKLGMYGIKLACDKIREGVDYEGVKKYLFEESGVEHLRQILISHFGNRSFIIKLSKSLRDLQKICFMARQGVSGKASEHVEDVEAKIASLIAKRHEFRELQVLRLYYEQALPFNEQEVRWILAVTGEWGGSIFQRLDMPEGAAFEELQKQAEQRMNYFQKKARTSFFMNRQAQDAASTIADSFALLLQHLKQINSF